MSDGFADPDPAGQPDTDDTVRVAGGALLDIGADASCTDCSHFQTCAIFKGIAPMMEDWPQNEHTDDGGPPVDVTDLAYICREYDPEVDDVDA